MVDISKGRYWDFGWQLIDGCIPCSPGCDHCWSASLTHRFNFQWTDKGRFNGKITVHPEKLSIPLKRRKPTVYAIWNDLFHEDVPQDFIGEIFEIINQCPQHNFLLLTKRHEGAVAAWQWLGEGDDAPCLDNFPFGNVWSGLTVCNQQEADEKIPIFLRVPGKKFLCHEPALEAIVPKPEWLKEISVLISGGETGHGARPSYPGTFRADRDQCETAGVSFFFKSWGDYFKKGVKKRDLSSSNRILDGRTHDDLPWVQP